MKKSIGIIMLCAGLVAGSPAWAASPTNNLAQCLVDHLNGKERKSLAKWIFFAIAAHPEIKSYSSASPQDVKQSDEYVGKLITRMLTEDCPDELKKAYSADRNAIGASFKLVGEVAMQELMTSKNVTDSLTGYMQYTDIEKINELLR